MIRLAARKPCALIIDDQPASLLELSEIVGEFGFRVDTARDPESARAALAKRLPDVAILNIHIGGTDNEDTAFRLLSHTDLSSVIEVYLLTDDPDFTLAQRGMRAGASDILHRPEDMERLKSNLERLAGEVKAEIGGRRGGRRGAGGLLQGESPVMNCGAMPRELIESEMFGHRKGAFTGAHSSHKGYFERAAKGTLLLDEITEMSPDLQVKLLRVLETRRVRPAGGERDIGIDVRIIASTNRDPEEAVSEGVLRQDLYYRLAEFPLRVPPLRERGDDIVLLAEAFLRECNEREGRKARFSSEARDVLRLHDWPGNVRELQNAVSRAHILAAGEIHPDDLPGNIPSGGAICGDYLRFPVGCNLREMERRMILATVEHFGGDKPKSAKALGISLKTLYNRMKSYASNR